MRPVTIGNPPNYIYYTQAAEQGNNTTFATNSSVAIVYAAAGSVVGPPVTFSIKKTMKDLLNVSVKKYVFPNPVAGKVASAVELMRDHLADIYRQARPDLAAMIGEYCSFCELPIPDHLLAVEHRAPKAPYPTYTVWWWNFLLACRDCNSKKGSKPSRKTTTTWAGGSAPTEKELVDEIEGQYYWPDVDDNTYRVIRRKYMYDTDAVAPDELDDVDAASRSNTAVSFTGTTVTANVKDSGVMKNNRKVEVQIIRGPTADVIIGDRTLKLTGIDETGNGRCAQRTRVWLIVCTELDNLCDAVVEVPAAYRRGVFDRMWSLLLTLAVKFGFYSVWVDITKSYPFPAGMNTVGLQADLGAQFVWDTNPANNTNVEQVFRGVNVTKVP